MIYQNENLPESSFLPSLNWILFLRPEIFRKFYALESFQRKTIKLDDSWNVENRWVTDDIPRNKKNKGLRQCEIVLFRGAEGTVPGCVVLSAFGVSWNTTAP